MQQTLPAWSHTSPKVNSDKTETSFGLRTGQDKTSPLEDFMIYFFPHLLVNFLFYYKNTLIVLAFNVIRMAQFNKEKPSSPICYLNIHLCRAEGAVIPMFTWG